MVRTIIISFMAVAVWAWSGISIAGLEPNGFEMGQLEMTAANGQKQTALLLQTQIHGSVNGLVASITVEQSFTNQSKDWVHGRYVFPLPELAAVNDLEIVVGERIIRGVVQEKAQAKRTFEEAKQNGQKAGLLEQHRGNIFSVNMANIAPGEKIQTRLTYVDRVSFNDDVFELRLPTTLTPRYITGKPKPSGEQRELDQNRTLEVSHGWAKPTDQIPDAGEITPPQAHNLLPSGTHNFSLDLVLDPGLATDGVTSTTHSLLSSWMSNHVIKVALQNNTAPLDRDLVLQWQARDSAETQAALFQQHDGANGDAEHFNMLMLTPPQFGTRALPRDVTFVIDTSGSMGGTSIQQAKKALLQALTHLSVNDRFNVVEFNSRFTALFGKSEYAMPNKVLAAQRMVMGLGAGGGTEMAAPLSFAMQQGADSDLLRQIIFITDGSVGNEAELLKMIHQQLGNARLFTVAIGSAPNTFFMRKAADFGRGFHVHISDLNQVSDQIDLLSRRIQQPLMQNLKVDWPEKVEQYPKKLPDLYAGEPLVLLARSDHKITELTVSGQLDGQTWQQTLKISPTATNSSVEHLNTLWARAKVEDLMDTLLTSPESRDAVRSEVIQLGVEHKLATKYTSFVAVEQQPSRPKQAAAKHENVPNLMPHGSTMQAPQTATPARLLQLLGGLFLALALLLQKAPQFRWPAEMG